ncbi:hypothetical protein [Legionella sp. km772]|uniref:hypothetical protein n=1 Tax=Legionella sp. km772 TaxID=2498111 RepID=UPI000F8CACD6|nr:hypothetical protein [Legionella sp. km772]RUR13302.1 hypothetical protein ELY15_02910 [Legionella sp. km772]
MSDFKSKLPDLKELGSMTSKLFSGLKTTVNEIIHDYKEKRAEEEAKAQADEALRAKEAPVQETVVKETVVTETTVKAETPIPPAEPVKPVEPPPPIVAEEEKEDENKAL